MDEKLKLTHRQLRLLNLLVEVSDEQSKFGMAITSGPNGSIWPSLRKRGFVETVLVPCACCRANGRSMDDCARPDDFGRVTDLGLEAVEAYA